MWCSVKSSIFKFSQIQLWSNYCENLNQIVKTEKIKTWNRSNDIGQIHKKIYDYIFTVVTVIVVTTVNICQLIDKSRSQLCLHVLSVTTYLIKHQLSWVWSVTVRTAWRLKLYGSKREESQSGVTRSVLVWSSSLGLYSHVVYCRKSCALFFSFLLSS